VPTVVKGSEKYNGSIYFISREEKEGRYSVHSVVTGSVGQKRLNSSIYFVP
jgi:hypothetical protein